MSNDWANKYDDNKVWSALNGKTIIIGARRNNRYLRTSCLDDTCAKDFGNALRVVASAKREEAIADVNCHWIVHYAPETGAGFYLESVTSKKVLHALQSIWFGTPLKRDALFDARRAITDSSAGESSSSGLKDSAIQIVAKVSSDSLTPGPDGNYVVFAPMMTTLHHPTHVSERSQGKGLVKIYNVTNDSRDKDGVKYALGELISTYDGLVDDRVDSLTLFSFETLVPPDLKEWLSTDENKIKCVMNLAGPGRQRSSCESALGMQFMGSRELQDKFMHDAFERNPDLPVFACYKLQKRMKKDFADIGEPDLAPPVACLAQCSAPGVYQSRMMSEQVAGGNCKIGCYQSIKIGTGDYDSSTAERVSQSCSTGGGSSDNVPTPRVDDDSKDSDEKGKTNPDKDKDKPNKADTYFGISKPLVHGLALAGAVLVAIVVARRLMSRNNENQQQQQFKPQQQFQQQQFQQQQFQQKFQQPQFQPQQQFQQPQQQFQQPQQLNQSPIR